MGTFTLHGSFREHDGDAASTTKVEIYSNTQIRGVDGETIFEKATVPVVGGEFTVTLPANDNQPLDFGYTVRRQFGDTKKWQVPVQAPGATVELWSFTSTTPLPMPPTTVVNSINGQTGVVTLDLGVGDAEIAALIGDEDSDTSAALTAFFGSNDNLYPDAVTADAPAGYWRLGETSGSVAADETGNHPGTYVGGVTLGADGLTAGSNKAALFNGTSGHVVVETGAIISGQTNWTIEAIAVLGDGGMIYGERGSSGNDILKVELKSNNGRVELTYRDHAGVINQVESTNSLVGAGAHHIVLVKEGTALRFYFDGALDKTAVLTASDTFGEATTQSWIGADPTGSGWYNGTLDEVAVYDTALLSGRIAAHYSAMLGEEVETAADGAPQVNPIFAVTTAGGVQIVSKETYVNATLALTGTGNLADVFDTFRIRGRGNLTWMQPKKPYKVKLDNSLALLGMPTSKDWALLANYFDHAAVNTQIADQLGYLATGLAWTPKYGYVDVFLNGSYQGNYQLIESVQFAATRVNHTKATGTTGLPLTGAYLLEVSLTAQDDDPSFTTTNGTRVLYDDPDGSDATQAAYIADWVQDFEDVLYGGGFAHPTTGYRAWIDVPSFIDWYLIEEFAKNDQGEMQTSAKCYKTRDIDGTPGKLYMGPLWDFDESFGTYNGGLRSSSGFGARLDGKWIDRLFDDPIFFDEVVDRWTTLKNAITAAGGINKIIDRAIARTATPQIRDGAKWGYDADWSAISTYKKTWVAERMVWMDAQYGTPSGSGYPDAVNADNPISYWRLGDTSGTTAVDAKGVNNGTYSGGYTLGTTGLLSTGTNKAITLNGSTGKVVVKAGGAIISGLTNWSIEAIIDPSATGRVLYGERGSSGQDILCLSVESGDKLRVTYRDHAGVLNQPTMTNSIPAGAHHIVVTKAGTSLKFYVDAVLDSTHTLTASDTFGEVTTQSWIGADPTGSQWFQGIVDEVAVYNVALSQARITAHNAAK